VPVGAKDLRAAGSMVFIVGNGWLDID